MVMRYPKLNGAEEATPREGSPAGTMAEETAAPVVEAEVIISNLV